MRRLLVLTTALLAGAACAADGTTASTTIDELEDLLRKHAGRADGSSLELSRFGDTTLLITSPGAASGRTVAVKLDQRVTCDFQDATLSDVAAFIRAASGINVVLDPAVVLANRTVTLRVEAMRLANVLTWVRETARVHIACVDQAIFISAKPVTGAARTVAYDVADLVMPIPDFPGKEMGFSRNADF